MSLNAFDKSFALKFMLPVFIVNVVSSLKFSLIPLDILFVLNNRINRIHSNCEAPDPHRMTLPRYTGIGDHIIEFPAGTCDGWKVGDKVAMYLGTPLNPVR